MEQKVDIILASGSPRRRELLHQVGLDFTVLVTDADESINITEPSKVVEELSYRKAKAAVECYLSSEDSSAKGMNREEVPSSSATDIKREGVLVVSADTVVALDEKIIGKPKDKEDALGILMNLSGRTHDVYTGVSCIYIVDGKIVSEERFSERTGVTMYPFDEDEALDYIASGEPMDKAGAYGIQGIGARLVEKIEGDYNNVVGFPLSAFLRRGKSIIWKSLRK